MDLSIWGAEFEAGRISNFFSFLRHYSCFLKIPLLAIAEIQIIAVAYSEDFESPL
jgi:hypothetical protein